MDKKWYQEGKNTEGVRDNAWQTFSSIKEDTVAQRQMQERHLRLYSNIDAVSNPYYQIDVLAGLTRGVTLNIVQSIVDTLVSKIGSIKPGITFLSNGAGFEKRINLQDLNDFIYALFRQAMVYETGRLVFRDAAIFGNGYMKPFRKGNAVAVERVLPGQIFVDNFDGLYGKPSQIFQQKYVNKSVLENRFKKKIHNTDAGSINQNTKVVDLVEVVEGWYLSEDAGKRRHVITTRDNLLLDEPYPCPHDPIQVLRYNQKPIGFEGTGVVEPLVGIQREINKVAAMIQRAINVASNVFGFVPAGSGVTEEMFSNERRQLAVINYKGQIAPNVQTFQAVSPELFKYLDSLQEKAFELSGMSQMHATGRKQPGVTSGVAIQSVLDIESQRFLELEQNYHEFYGRVAKHCVWLCDEISQNENVEVAFEDEDTFRKISWQDIDLEQDKYEIQSYATNLLPRTPEGKLQRISELMEMGLATPDEARKMMGFPDIKQEADLASAGKDLVRKVVDNIVNGKEIIQPDKYMDLNFALTHATQMYNLCRLKPSIYDPNALEELLGWISDVEDLLDEAEQEMMAQEAAMAPPPPEGGMPPEGAPPMPM